MLLIVGDGRCDWKEDCLLYSEYKKDTARFRLHLFV